MNYKILKNKFILVIALGVFSIFSFTPLIIIADEIQYTLLAPLPLGGTGSDLSETTNPKDYVEGIVMLVIAVAGVLAVLKIIVAGIKYMSTDSFQGKSEGKGDIQNAVWGLALAMSAWLILNTINPNLTGFQLEIPGLKVGGEFETNLGRIPTREEIDATKKDVGCLGCSPIPFETDPSTRPIFGTSHPKTPGNGCESGTPFCLVDNDLVRKLQQLTTAIQKRAGYTKAQDPANDRNEINWQVTEMYPPTRPHQHACHNPNNEVTGMCVDASLRDLECAKDLVCPAKKGFLGATVTHTERVLNDAKKIRVFIEEANKLGLSVVYEVETEERLNQLQNTSVLSSLKRQITAPKYTSGVKAGYSAITGEHFSIYLNNAVREYKFNSNSD